MEQVLHYEPEYYKYVVNIIYIKRIYPVQTNLSV